MATYFVTTDPAETWNDDPAAHHKTRAAADARVRELLALNPVVRLVRWEDDRPVKEERFTPDDLGGEGGSPLAGT